MNHVPSLDFFHEIHWAEVVFEVEPEAELRTGAYPGSSLRGALGYFFQRALCHRRPACVGGCADPSNCRFVSLFEPAGGGGPRATRPYVLRAPIPEQLRLIAGGGPVASPYRLAPPLRQGIAPALDCEGPLVFARGSRVCFSLALFGEAAAVLPALIDALAAAGLDWAGVRCRLVRAVDGARWNRVLYDARQPRGADPPMISLLGGLLEDRPACGRMRVVLESPTLVKLERRACLDPDQFAKLFFEQCLVRAIRMHDFVCRPGARLPWGSVSVDGWRLAKQRLFHYRIPRRSLRQERDVEFDGLLGWMDFEGDLSEVVPLARAAEVLHIGQKTSFGMGRVACHIQDGRPREAASDFRSSGERKGTAGY